MAVPQMLRLGQFTGIHVGMTRVGQSPTHAPDVLAHAGAKTTNRPPVVRAIVPAHFAMYGLSFIQTCVECRRPWLLEGERWRAYHGCDVCDEPVNIVFYCPACAEREFGGD
jgi:hypothetical protein